MSPPPPPAGSLTLSRTFSPGARAQRTSNAPFELTREDFEQRYAVGNRVVISRSSALYQMDISGDKEVSSDETWALPQIDWETTETWEIQAPGGQPYAGEFPEATHVWYREPTSEEPARYNYYALTDDAIVLLGWVIPEGDEGTDLWTTGYNQDVIRLPVSEASTFEDKRVLTDSNSTSRYYRQVVAVAGYGQIVLPDGTTSDGINFFNQTYIQKQEDFGTENYEAIPTYYTLYDTDGTRFTFEVADDPEGGETNLAGEIYLTDAELWQVVETSTSAHRTDEVPRTLVLDQNYPNPFNPETAIHFSVPSAGRAVLRLYDMLGREVDVLFDGQAVAGQRHAVHLEARNLPTGVYAYVLEHGGRRVTRKLIIAK